MLPWTLFAPMMNEHIQASFWLVMQSRQISVWFLQILRDVRLEIGLWKNEVLKFHEVYIACILRTTLEIRVLLCALSCIQVLPSKLNHSIVNEGNIIMAPYGELKCSLIWLHCTSTYATKAFSMEVHIRWHLENGPPADYETGYGPHPGQNSMGWVHIL